nr:DUF2950 family protein [Neoroseomonas marina]
MSLARAGHRCQVLGDCRTDFRGPEGERQGPAAPGGAMDYVVNGHMTGGFAIIASPARCGSTGIKTFMISHDGMVWEQDLGPGTEREAAAIEAFDPDQDWPRVAE